jgi:hypothetical protein
MKEKEHQPTPQPLAGRLRLAHLRRKTGPGPEGFGRGAAGGRRRCGWPLLVFLDLLKRQPEGVPEIGLAHIEHEPSHAHAAANMLVDRIFNAPGHQSSHHQMASVPMRLRRRSSCCCVPKNCSHRPFELRQVGAMRRVIGWGTPSCVLVLL